MGCQRESKHIFIKANGLCDRGNELVEIATGRKLGTIHTIGDSPKATCIIHARCSCWLRIGRAVPADKTFAGAVLDVTRWLSEGSACDERQQQQIVIQHEQCDKCPSRTGAPH